MKTKFQWRKWLAVWGFFLLLHFSYETFPNPVMLIFGEQSEATITHMKMTFWAYLFGSALEYFWYRKQIKSVEQFVYTRLFVAVAYPWLVITVWHTALALGITLPEFPWEIIYANITTAIGVYIALRLEEILDAVEEYRPSFKASIVMLFLLALVTYTSFTFKAPGGFANYFYWGP
jgi:hypothetical protein